MKLKQLFLMIGTVLVLGGCSAAPDTQKTPASYVKEVTVGDCLQIKNINKRLKLLDNKDALSANGLYYVAWGIGNAQDYENSDGDTVDLYDAQLYLLLEESKNQKNAQENLDEWLKKGRENYEILSEEEILCNGQTYQLITYNCKNKDNPYDRGVSAFGIYENNAICAELTCQEGFEEDLKALLTNFLDNCSYTTD